MGSWHSTAVKPQYTMAQEHRFLDNIKYKVNDDGYSPYTQGGKSCWDKMKAYFQIKNKTNVQYRKICMIKIHMQKELTLSTPVTNRCD
jgi:hypothetical protein